MSRRDALPLDELVVLDAVATAGDVGVQTLADELMMDEEELLAICQRLAERGLVTFEVDVSDLVREPGRQS